MSEIAASSVLPARPPSQLNEPYPA